jgi:hypothetical protein
MNFWRNAFRSQLGNDSEQNLITLCADTEFHLRQYLKGFSTAIVLVESSPQQKVETILAWMSKGPRRTANEDADTSCYGL